jgi:hypothetical protein
MIRTCKYCHKDYEIPQEWAVMASQGFIPFNEGCPKCMSDLGQFDWAYHICLCEVLKSGNPLSYLSNKPELEDYDRAAKAVIAYMQDHPDNEPTDMLFDAK